MGDETRASVHTIKLRKQFVEPVLMSEKCFEVRKDDRGYAVDDLVRFEVVGDDDRPAMPETTRELAVVATLERSLYRITYLVRGYGLRDGYVAFGLEGVL